VRRYFARGSLRQRVIALAAAYLIALAGLLASFGTASVAAADITNSSGFLCHTAAGGSSSPADDQSNNQICAERCGIGCLMMTAALPPPPAGAAALLFAAAEVVHPLAIERPTLARQTKSHRSRAPPRTA
jgi:hypothetical protein